MSSATVTQGRKRSKLACKTCRELKRKCDGAQPCGTCVRFEYDCTYQGSAGHKRKATTDIAPRDFELPAKPSPTSSRLTGPPASGPGPSITATHNPIRSLEANSGSAFLRRLALRLDPKDAPRLHAFAWNVFLGCRKGAHAPSPRPIIEMMSQAEMEGLASVYFEKVDPIYGFVDKQDIYQHISRKWATRSSQDISEAVLCGVAALGSLFSHPRPETIEFDLIESARLILEPTTYELPSTTTVIAWLLRVVYLRVADTQNRAWMASSILMHLVEAAGLHSEPTTESVLPTAPGEVDPELRRRIVSVSQHINVWLSFDMGRSRVTLFNGTMIMPSARPGDYTVELMELLPYTAQLDPERAPDVSDLEAALVTVLARVHSKPPSVLAQANLVLCLCRRLQSCNGAFREPLLEQILCLTSKGLAAAQAILDDRAPWHHMAHVPFQVVCLLLAVDNPLSIARLGDAMQCLRNVAEVYNTDATWEALKTASVLISLHKRFKERSAAALGDLLELYPVTQSRKADNQPQVDDPDDVRWMNIIAEDLSNVPFFDVNQLLTPYFLKENYNGFFQQV